MTTNGEWLFSKPFDEQVAWMNAEHQDGTLDGDTEPENSNTGAVSGRYSTAFKWLDRLDYSKGGVIDNSLCDTPEQGEVVMPLESWREYLGAESENADSRDKLEADAERYIEHAADYAYEDTLWADETFTLYDAIIELLDRQAEIIRTEDEAYCQECNNEQAKRVCELEAQIAELTAERDELKFNISLVRKNRDKYRSKFGKCLDYADAIHSLMDEGTA